MTGPSFSDRRWQASLQVEGRRLTKYGKTRAEAQRELKTLQRQASLHGALPSNATLSELLERWLATEHGKWKPRTRSITGSLLIG